MWIPDRSDTGQRYRATEAEHVLLERTDGSGQRSDVALDRGQVASHLLRVSRLSEPPRRHAGHRLGFDLEDQVAGLEARVGCGPARLHAHGRFGAQ